MATSSEAAASTDVNAHPNAIHVKGLPSNATETDVNTAFAKFGTILPSSKYMAIRGYAIIDFESSDSADKAIASPQGSVSVAGSAVVISRREARPPRQPRKPKAAAAGGNGEAPAPDAPPKRVVVTPINPEATKEEVSAAFAKFGEITNITIRSRNDGTKAAFVVFSTVESASAAAAESGKLNIKGASVTIELRNARKTRTKRTKKAAPKNGAEGAAAGSATKEKPKKAAKEPAEQTEPAIPKSLHVRSVPLNTTSDMLTEAFSKFGAIVRATAHVSSASAFLDYATEEEREKVLAAERIVESSEKAGSFGTADLRIFRSRGKKGEDTFTLGVRGFSGVQTPTEDDMRKIYATAKPTRVTIMPARAFAFVDFDQAASLEKALGAQVKLAGSSEVLQTEPSKKPTSENGEPRRRRFNRRRGNRKGAAAAEGEDQ